MSARGDIRRVETLLVTGSDRRGARALAAALATEAGAECGGGVILAEPGGAPRRPTLLAAPGARALERALRERGLPAAARGHFCSLWCERDPKALAELAAAAKAAGARSLHVLVPGELWEPALDSVRLAVGGAVLLARMPAERSLAALAAAELSARGVRLRVVDRAPSALAARRALAGVRPGGEASARAGRIAARLRGGRSGQALPAVLAIACGLLLTALALAAIGGAVTGKGRAQRAADLAALSAARSMRDDGDRLLAPARLPDGRPNPRHLSRREYLERAEAAAREAADRNGVGRQRLRISFPDAKATPPLRAKARVTAEIDPGELAAGRRLSDAGEPQAPIEIDASAVAEASAPAGSWTGMPTRASGGGYSGPLVHRHGEGMRPDVAAAYDRMASAARAAGHALVVTSGFRSDAEQAELFERHPDPRWVAPPGRSLHRCATELDLGPSSAWGWLAANARQFGFVKRYSWEAWHFGYVEGPPPCSQAGESGGLASGAGDPDGGASATAPPSFVPAQYRDPLLHSAGRWNVSAALLAAQLMAESGFNPRAVSPAGARGIAQFMPGTAASYGLRDPFDPVASIDAQAHLMSDLLRQFRSVPLALAAYNAGPGAVSGCRCIPYAETRAYVTRILALLDGAGAVVAPPLEVRLVE